MPAGPVEDAIQQALREGGIVSFFPTFLILSSLASFVFFPYTWCLVPCTFFSLFPFPSSLFSLCLCVFVVNQSSCQGRGFGGGEVVEFDAAADVERSHLGITDQ